MDLNTSSGSYLPIPHPCKSVVSLREPQHGCTYAFVDELLTYASEQEDHTCKTEGKSHVTTALERLEAIINRPIEQNQCTAEQGSFATTGMRNVRITERLLIWMKHLPYTQETQLPYRYAQETQLPYRYTQETQLPYQYTQETQDADELLSIEADTIFIGEEENQCLPWLQVGDVKSLLDGWTLRTGDAAARRIFASHLMGFDTYPSYVERLQIQDMDFAVRVTCILNTCDRATRQEVIGTTERTVAAFETSLISLMFATLEQQEQSEWNHVGTDHDFSNMEWERSECAYSSKQEEEKDEEDVDLESYMDLEPYELKADDLESDDQFDVLWNICGSQLDT